MTKAVYIRDFEQALISVVKDHMRLVTNVKERELLAFCIMNEYNVYAILLSQTIFQHRSYSDIFSCWKSLYSSRLKLVIKEQETFIKTHYNNCPSIKYSTLFN